MSKISCSFRNENNGWIFHQQKWLWIQDLEDFLKVILQKLCLVYSERPQPQCWKTMVYYTTDYKCTKIIYTIRWCNLMPCLYMSASTPIIYFNYKFHFLKCLWNQIIIHCKGTELPPAKGYFINIYLCKIPAVDTLVRSGSKHSLHPQLQSPPGLSSSSHQYICRQYCSS